MDEQLRQDWWVRASTIAERAHVNDGTSQDDTREAILALLATEYDRGQWVAFRLLKNQPEGSLKFLIMENLERLEGLKGENRGSGE